MDGLSVIRAINSQRNGTNINYTRLFFKKGKKNSQEDVKNLQLGGLLPLARGESLDPPSVSEVGRCVCSC